jgi:preprotein translocase SecE subunit
MAVAVKNAPGTTRPSLLDRPAVVSLLGALYVLVCLGIVFKAVPWAWGKIWTPPTFVGNTFMALVMLGVAAGLLVLGARLLGPRSVPGVRAGIFLGVVGLLVVLLLARWASLWVEHWAHDSRLFDPTTGAIVTAVITLALLVLGVRLFTRPRFQSFVVRFEAGGWFHATPYKSNQGQRVRRGTIFGILVLVGAGIYTLLSHNTLRKGSPNWALNIPFTGRTVLESFGDTRQWLAGLPAPAKDTVRVRYPGRDLGLTKGDTISARQYREKVQAVLARGDLDAKTRVALVKALDGDIVDLLLAVNEQLSRHAQALLKEGFFRQNVARPLREVIPRTNPADRSAFLSACVEAAEQAKKADDLGPAFDLPTAVLVVDRYALRDVNANTDPNRNVRVGLVEGEFHGPDGKPIPEGAIISRDEYNAAVKATRDEVGEGFKPPPFEPLAPASGPTQFETLTLLPSVQFTLPLLLLAASIWLAWRVVNVPTFADFLIATEAEMNKVSWTTQRRLVQDTIVVLVTVLLMAVYLFLMDQVWRTVLSWPPIGVLQFPKNTQQENTSIEQKKW